MSDAIESRTSFVVGTHNVPRCVFCVGCFKHSVARARVVVPSLVGLHVHWTELPLPEWIVNPGREALVLFLLPNLQPNL